MPDFVFALVAHGKPLTEINAHPGLQVYREGRVVELPEGRGRVRLKAKGERALNPVMSNECSRRTPGTEFDLEAP